MIDKFEEPQVAPLKSSVASIVIENIVSTGGAAARSKRQTASNMGALGLLKRYESQGGKL